MDPNYKSESDSGPLKPLPVGALDLIRLKIRECIETKSDPNGPAIQKFCEPLGYSQKHVSHVLGGMISKGEVRQKEDSFEHEWVYRQGSNW